MADGDGSGSSGKRKAEDYVEVKIRTDMDTRRVYVEHVRRAHGFIPGEFMTDVVTVRTEADFNRRSEIIKRLRKARRDVPNEIIELSLNEIANNMDYFGGFFSNILMSYIIKKLSFQNEIDHKLHCSFQLLAYKIHKRMIMYKDNPINHPNSEQEIKKLFAEFFRRTHVNRFFKKSGIDYYTGLHKTKKVVRCTLLFDFYFMVDFNSSNNKIIYKGHEMLFYWQIELKRDVPMLEFGACDNLDMEYYKANVFGLNLNIFDIFKKAFDDVMKEEKIEIPFYYRFINNNLSLWIKKENKYKDFNYRCMTAARRAVIFASLFHDFDDFRVIEDKKPGTDAEVHTSITERAARGTEYTTSSLFLYHLHAYMHHINRMMEWALSSPLLWPEPGQTEPTSERPICVLYSELFKRETPQSCEAQCVVLNFRPLHTKLYNFFNGQTYTLDFSYDGPEAFVVRRTEAPTPDTGPQYCVVSSQFERDLRAVTAGLAARLRALEVRGPV